MWNLTVAQFPSGVMREALREEMRRVRSVLCIGKDTNSAGVAALAATRDRQNEAFV